MRILALTNLYPNPLQPHRAPFNRQQLRAIAEAGHEVRVIAPIAWTDELSARWRGKFDLGSRRSTTDGIPVVHPRYVFTPKVLREWYGKFYHRSVRGAFRRAAAEFRPDIIFTSWAYPDAWAAAALARAAGLPVVMKVHGSDLLVTHTARVGIVSEAVKGVDGVIAVSEDLARRAVELGADPQRVRVVYSGVDATVFRPGDRGEARRRLGLDPEAPVVLFVGNLVPVKGLDVLVEACAQLAGRGVRFGLYLVGQGAQRGALERQVAERGLAAHVRFVGPVANALLPDWYRAADVFVLPSRSEGVPNVLLEAAACGTRFVATRVGGVPEVAEWGDGQLVPPGDAAALADAVGRSLGGATVAGAGCDRPGRTRSHADAAAEMTEFFRQTLERRAAAADSKVPA